MMQSPTSAHQPLDNGFIDMGQAIPMPRTLLVPHPFHRCMFFSAWLMTFISTCILLAVSCTMASVSNEVADVFHDSQTTLTDLQVIIPEIKESLQILDDFCGMPDFAQYCHPS